MQIESLDLSTLTCFCCAWEKAEYKCKLQIDDDIFLTICLCHSCVKLDETELKSKFTVKSKTETTKTVKQAAKILNVNTSKVHYFIKLGRLQAEKVGRDLIIKSDDLERFAEIERRTGRPSNVS